MILWKISQTQENALFNESGLMTYSLFFLGRGAVDCISIMKLLKLS